MNPTALKCLLSAACVAVPVLSLAAQSAPVGGVAVVEVQDPKPRQGQSRERMQARLAEVLAMLEEDDLSPEQRAKVKANLHEVMERLAQAQATEAPDAPARRGAARYRVHTTDGDPVRTRVIEVEGREGKDRKVIRVGGGGGVEVVEIAEETPPGANLSAPAEAPMAPMPGEAPKPPKPAKAPKAPKAVRALVLDSQGEAGEVLELKDIEAVRARLDLTRANHAQLEAVHAELEAKHHADAARLGRAHAEHGQDARVIEVLRADGFARARAAHRADEQAAEAHAKAAENLFGRAQARAPGQRASAGRNQVNRSHGESDESDVREMIEEMRAEMREIRSLIRELRERSDDMEEDRTGALAPGLPSGSLPTVSRAESPLGAVPLIGSLFGSASASASTTPAPASAVNGTK